MPERADKRPQTLIAAVRYFTPEKASAYVRSIKWPDGPCCPECGSISVGFIKSRNRHQCREKECRRQFSLTTGTIMEGTHLGLDQWMVAVWMIVNCRNGVSSCEIARTVGCKQQSAWHLLHRVRHILGEDFDGKMSGTVEADSTLVGGIVRRMPAKRRAKVGRGPWAGKTIVHAFKERDSGRVRASVLDRDTQSVMREEIIGNVEPGSRVHTDMGKTYRWISKAGFTHETVNHSADEYVRGDVTTNGCENYFACLRRSLKGTYIRPTSGHLQAYCDEATFRFNVRDLSEWDRFEAAMKNIVGKRLTYSELTDGAVR